jgi:hypothetical protein
MWVGHPRLGDPLGAVRQRTVLGNTANTYVLPIMGDYQDHYAQPAQLTPAKPACLVPLEPVVPGFGPNPY